MPVLPGQPGPGPLSTLRASRPVGASAPRIGGQLGLKLAHTAPLPPPTNLSSLRSHPQIQRLFWDASGAPSVVAENLTIRSDFQGVLTSSDNLAESD